MEIIQEQVFQAENVSEQGNAIWLICAAVVSDTSLIVRLALQEKFSESDVQSVLNKDYIETDFFHNEELAYISITTILNSQLITFAEQKTRDSFEGNGFGSFLFEQSIIFIKKLISIMLKNYPQVISYWVDDISENGWTSRIAKRNDFEYQGNQPAPTFLKKIPVLD